MATRRVQIALMLSAYDRMSAVVNSAVNRANAKLTAFQAKQDRIASKAFSTGRDAAGLGIAAAASLYAPIKAFSDLEDAGLRLKSVMMRDGGIVPERLFKKMNDQAVYLGNLLPGTTADFQNLYATMLEQGTPAQAILNGTGKAAAYLAVQLKMPTEQAGILASRLRLQMGVADNEMMKFMDIMARIKNVGVDPVEMQYAFGRSAGVMKLLNVQGLAASKTMGTLFAMLIREGGATGETVGTGISRIMNELMNPTKMAKFNANAKTMGLQFEFFRNGKFLGMENFVGQLTKFQGMDPEKISKLLLPLTGGEGTDNSFLASLSKMVAGGFIKMTNELSRQATLQQKVDLQLGSLKSKWEAATGTFTNSMAAFGGTFAPILKDISDKIGTLSVSLQNFINKNPVLSKWIGLLIIGFATLAITGAGLSFAIGGVAKSFALASSAGSFLTASLARLNFAWFAMKYHLVYTVWPAVVSATAAFWKLNVALWANPVGAVVLALIALGAGFYIAYQRSEKFRAAISGIIAVGNILGHVFVGVGKSIMGALTFNPAMMIAGAKQAAAAVSAIANGGIAKSFNTAYNASISQSKASANGVKPVANNSGTKINFSPVNNFNGNPSKADVSAISAQQKTDFMKMMREFEYNKARVAY